MNAATPPRPTLPGRRTMLAVGLLATNALAGLPAAGPASAETTLRLGETVRVVTKLDGKAWIVRAVGGKDATLEFQGDGRSILQTAPSRARVGAIQVVNGDRFKLGPGTRSEFLVVSEDGRSTVAATERDLTRPTVLRRLGRSSGDVAPEVARKLQRVLGVKGIKGDETPDEALILPLPASAVRSSLVPILIGNAKGASCEIVLSAIAGRSYPLARWSAPSGSAFTVSVPVDELRRRYEAATGVRLDPARLAIDAEIAVTTPTSTFVRPVKLLLTDAAVVPPEIEPPIPRSETGEVLVLLDLQSRFEAANLVSEGLARWAGRIPEREWSAPEEARTLRLATLGNVVHELGLSLASFRDARFRPLPPASAAKPSGR